MVRLRALGSNTESGVPYTDEEINAMAQKGKQRGHLPRVDSSGSGGCGDDEIADDEDGGEDEEDEEDEEDGDRIWCLTGQNILLIVVYAPQDLREKNILWDYLKCEIGRWKGEVVIMGDFNEAGANRDKALYIRDLVDIDGIIDCGKGREDDVIKRAEIINKIQKIDELNSKDLAQKIKINIRGVMVDGIWVDDPHKVKNEFMEHFSTRFCNPGNKGASIQMEFPKKISDTQLREIESEVTNEEIKKAVWDCGTEKAPGPDGFTFGFYRHYWYLIHNDVYAAVRQILDGPFILNEVLQWCKTKAKQAMIFKVDFEKAFDSVRWDFLDDVLRKFGFGDTWCKWIQCCLKSSRGSILVNGSPTEEFQFGKGLKQGDPLSPFLFILIMESLHLSFQHIVDAGMFHGIKLGGGLVNLSHMFYADDVVFVGQWCASNITTLIHVLDCFHKASGLRINMSKSKIMGVHVDSERVNTAAMKLGCLVLKTPFTYLGSIVGGNMSRKQSWIETVDKIKKKLSKWKMNTLSIGGRLTLTKSVWRFITQKNTLWTRVIQALHGVNGRIRVASRGGYNSCWTAIIQETNSLLTKGIDVMNHIRIKLGNGDKTMFWEDKWTPRGGIEMDQFVKMIDDVKEVILSTSEDRWVWDLENTGEFSVSSIRNLIDEKTLPLTDYKTRWNKLFPIKVNILSWKIMTNSLPTRFNISCRGICTDSILCANCDKGVETSSHLFFSCSLARMVVNLILRWWSIPVVELDSYDDWTLWFDNVRLPLKNKKMLEGNRTIFDAKVPKKALLFDDILSKSFYWCRYRSKASFGWNYWLKNPNLIML
ncbi:RNA-directed DNA polymerase, eukaryota [Tanacetum coccineum]